MERDARLIALAGVVLFALSLVNGFLAHVLAQSRQAVSAHLVGLIGSGLLFALAALWPRLNHGPRASTVAAGLAIYGFGAGWLVNFLAAVTGRFGIYPISASAAPGGGPGDLMVSVGLASVALALLALCAMLGRALLRERA